MKKKVLIAVLSCITLCINAQSGFQQNGSSLYYKQGKVGIGTSNPSMDLTIKGRFSISPEGIVSDEGYCGMLMITKPKSSGQFINLTRAGHFPWSLGTVYDNSNFAIGEGKVNDNLFTNPFFVIDVYGKVGIGTVNPGAKLDVIGDIRAHEVKVCLNQGCDFVFEENYPLMKFDDLANFIKTNKHLPEIAPASVMESEGINLSEMNAKLLQKIEEQTLYILELHKQIQEIKKELKAIEKINNN